MPFSREGYRRLATSKYGCAETNELCGSEQLNPADLEDNDLGGYSLDFSQPKNRFVSQMRRSCGNIKQLLASLLSFTLRRAFGKWQIALIVLVCYIGLTVGLIVVALTGRYREFRKDISLDSFMVPDIKVSSDYAAFNTAKDQAKSSHFSNPFRKFLNSETCTGNKLTLTKRRYPRRSKRHVIDNEIQNTISGTLDLVYVAKGDDASNIFTKERLQEIHNIEKKLMKHEDYNKHCLRTEFSLLDTALNKYDNCTPPNSLINFFFPTGNIFDGQGDHLVRPIRDTLKYLQSKEYFFSYVTNDFLKKNRSNILRAQILFGKPVEGVPSDSTAQKEEFKRHVRTYVETLDKLNNNNQVSILYGGGDLFDYLVDQALTSDVRKAAISLGLIILLLLILTFSLWLTFMAVLTIVSSVGLAYFFYRVVFGVQYMGILNGVSLFVIIGIGVDDIFVFINTFRQAVDNKNLGSRILHTICVAGKATFFTSFTTASAFGANALSPIPAIHDFGLFMAVLVASCWISVIFLMSPALTLWHAGIEKMESVLCNKVLLAIGLRRSESLRLPDDIRRFLSGFSNNYSRRDNSGHDSDHEEIPLVANNNHDINNVDDDDDDDDDEPLLVIDDESSETATENVYSTHTIGFRLQSILYHFVAIPVIKAQVVIFVAYIFLLGGSAFLVTKLKVSTEQPKFFKADSNLQRWMELPEVSLKWSTEMKKDLNNMEKSLLPTTPAKAIVTSAAPKPKPRQTQSRIRTRRKSTTSTPRYPTTKPLPTRNPLTTESKRPSTRGHSTRQPSTEAPSSTTKETKGPVTTTRLPYTSSIPSTAMVPTSIPKLSTSKHGNWTEPTTLANGSSTVKPKRQCPQCISGKCNNETFKCDCIASYTGETCAEYCPVRTTKGDCCVIPFTSNEKLRRGCLIDENDKPWCSLTGDYDKDHRKGTCNETVEHRCAIRTETPNKTCCYFPFVYKMIQYYTCLEVPGWEGSYCGIQTEVSSQNELKRCHTVNRPTQPPLCLEGSCKPASPPPNEATALVYLVFGIKGIDKTSVDLRHVLKENQGTVVYDKAFSKDMSCDTQKMFKRACKICKTISSNRELVKPRGSECFTKDVRVALAKKFDDCQDLPAASSKKIKSFLVIKKDPERGSRVEWLAMAFSSTTETHSSYSSQREDYKKWEKQLQDVLSEKDVPDSLKSGFQTSETWVKMFSGIIVVDSAIYGIVASLLFCLAAVIIFTGHALLFIVLTLTVLGVLLMVTTIFYLTGWQLGGVEAISLSILVGTSVDYCFHLVEGYILAGEAVDPALNKVATRAWRAKAAMSHIGMSIISSAITTILAAIPLCLTQIQLFAKFGLIVTINTGISLLYTITVTMAMLSIFGPARFKASLRACAIGFLVVISLGGLGILVAYLMSTKGGYCIESPSGTPVFNC